MGVTPRQFEQMQKRLGGARRKPEPAFQGTLAKVQSRQVVLGIDPSLRGTGYGIIQTGKPAPRAVVFGAIACAPAWERSRCLARIGQTLRELLQQHRPSVCVIEGLFYAQNLQTALLMGEARGAALAAVAEGGLDVFEIAPRKVKQAIVGYGGAQKLAVAKMVQRILGLAEPPQADAADALALALAYAQTNRFGLTAHKKI